MSAEKKSRHFSKKIPRAVVADLVECLNSSDLKLVKFFFKPRLALIFGWWKNLFTMSLAVSNEEWVAIERYSQTFSSVLAKVHCFHLPAALQKLIKEEQTPFVVSGVIGWSLSSPQIQEKEDKILYRVVNITFRVQQKTEERVSLEFDEKEMPGLWEVQWMVKPP